MQIGMIFWMLMILWLIFGFVAFYPYGAAQEGGPRVYAPLGSNLLLFVLLFLLGWKVFGFVVQA